MPDPGAHRAESIVMAFDFGTSRIGVAIGNSLTRSARALSTVRAEPVALRFERIAALLREWQPDRLLVGRPLHADGAPNPRTAACERFARQLSGRFRLPVQLVDERFSSVAADEVSPAEDRTAGLDARSAATILRQYLATIEPIAADR